MKQRFIISFLVGFILVSCYKVEQPEKPSNLIAKDKMVAVLIDMSIMSSAKGVNKKKLEVSGVVPESYIYEKHNIDSVVFYQSTAYYAFDIKAYDDIYARVNDSLTVLRDKYKAIESKEKKEKEKTDSIKRAKVAAEKKLKKKASQKNKTVTEGKLKPLKTK